MAQTRPRAIGKLLQTVAHRFHGMHRDPKMPRAAVNTKPKRMDHEGCAEPCVGRSRSGSNG